MSYEMKRPWRVRLVVARDGPYGRTGVVLARAKEAGAVGQYVLRRRNRAAFDSGFVSVQHSEDGENWS